MPRRSRSSDRNPLTSRCDRDEMIVRGTTRIDRIGVGERRESSQPIPRPLVKTAAARKPRLGHLFSSVGLKLRALQLYSLGFHQRERARSFMVRKRLWCWRRWGWADPELHFPASRQSLRLVVAVVLLLVASPTEAWWTPGPGVSWQWQMEGELYVDVDVDMFNIDLFDVSEAEIEVLQERGVVVICSFSAGTYEEDRADSGDFESSWLGYEVEEGEDGERWLNVTQNGVLSIMESRLDLAVNKSCDGVEPSNVQGFREESGFNISYSDQLDFNSWIAEQAHFRNLSVGLRNDWQQLDDLESSFDWALSEDCIYQGKCDAYRMNFVETGKAVLNAEYFQFDLSFCENVSAAGLDVIIKDVSLDSRRCSCQKPETDIDCDSLLQTSTAESAGSSSPWVIGTAVGASIAIIIVAALVSAWRRRKVGNSGVRVREGVEEVGTGEVDDILDNFRRRQRQDAVGGVNGVAMR